MERKNLIVIIVALVVVATLVITVGISYYNEIQREAFDSDLKNAYEIFETTNDIVQNVTDTQDFSNDGIKKSKTKLQSVKEQNTKAIEYLKDALTRTNDDSEKKIVELMISNHELYEKEIDSTISALDTMMQYNEGKISASQALSKTNNLYSSYNKTNDLIRKNLAEISKILEDNPDFEKRIKSLGIDIYYLKGNN